MAYALDRKDRLDEAQTVYQTATQLRPQEVQAWQGLIKLFERQDTEKLADYQQVAVKLAQIFYNINELYKSQDVVDKFVDFVRAHGDKAQYADALCIQLPESPLYPLLQARFPHPAKVYERVAQIFEESEKKRIHHLIGERRTRLGAKLSQVTAEVKREVYAQSNLEHIYRQLINWTSDDDLRRLTEEKLLQYCYDRLLATPAGPLKTQEQEKVLDLANGMVIIKHPFKLAWDISIDWQDHKETVNWDVDILRSYCSFFPESDLYKVITAFLTSTQSPFPPPDKQNICADPTIHSDDSDDEEDGGVSTAVVPLTEDDRLLMMTDGVSTANSTFAYRLAGTYLLHSGEFETTVELMRKAMEALERERDKTGLVFKNTEDTYRLCLGTSLVYYQSPRHHQEAKSLFDKVLNRDETSTPALIGVGLIYAEEEEYDQAVEFFARALKRDPSNLRVRSEAAWVKALNGDLESAKDELQNCAALAQEGHGAKELIADTQYRLGYCIWNLKTGRQERKRRKGECAYSCWLSALNNNLNHAPSYTSLGVYYEDYAKDKKRSRRCFQKALELSAAEVEAAERLARSFADEGDWDRVELVAQRVVDSGKVKPPPGSKRKGISWPFAALGVAELNKRDYPKAIVSFQAALRVSPDHYHSWIGLGESYHNSGRFIAATRAIANAQRLEEDCNANISGSTWFSKYMLANIKRELGEHDGAILLYRNVMETQPKEAGVIIALMQTMVENAYCSVERGLYGKGVGLALETISFAAKRQVADDVLGTFNFWKTVADACAVFSYVQSRHLDFPRQFSQALLENCAPEAFALLAQVDQVGPDTFNAAANEVGSNSTCAGFYASIQAAILFYKQAVHVCANDVHAQAVAHYNLGWAEQRAHACLPTALKQHTSSPYSKAAVRCFKRSIELESGNAEFWNALGVATSEINPSVAQHSFVRSLYLNERSPVPWTNLGILSLLAGDARMANETFTRAQSADPDYAHAWVGQGFVALLYGDTKEARGLFTHAMEISESSSLPSRWYYSASSFDHVLSAPPKGGIAALLQPLFALNQLRNLRPNNLVFGQLSSLFQERVRDNASSIRTLEEICSSLEAEYEATESSEALARFILARTGLARAYLAAGLYDKTVSCGEMALELCSDEADDELDKSQRERARLSNHLSIGLAHYFNHSLEEVVAHFAHALAESNESPDATCLLAQILWADGSESSKERARSALFGVIEKHPDHVQSVLLLGVTALLDDDEPSLEAVVEELQSLRTNDSVTNTEQSHISEVLRSIAALGSGQAPEDLLAQVQDDVMLHPHLPHGWSALSDATGDQYSADMALKVAERSIPPRGTLEARDLAMTYAGTARVGHIQRAAILAPWERRVWESLGVATQDL